ncbi:ATP-binding cassette transporter activity protein [Scheffersomyces coipomensis]|uniref:ATP-binding cassette transporter activity protein n=1 Tax=Scheffersomyces coipomensis TaxID=1788519 RepID=UPI00315C4D47
MTLQDHFNDTSLAIELGDLDYIFPGTSKVALHQFNLKISWGTTNLIIGPNGAGKSTLLRILAGKTLIGKGSLKIGGFDPFEFSINRMEQHNSDINNYITYLGTEWAANSVVKRDIPVSLLISSIGGETFVERRNELIEILDIDPQWSMSKISDGERRRVQIAMGLIKPWKLLLLDEVTIDLDVVVRSKLLSFLKRESKTRNCCVIYATHIFDGLGKNWCDRLIHVNAGLKVDDINMEDIEFSSNIDTVEVDTRPAKRVKIPMAESLHPLALQWLNEDLAQRGSREDERLLMARRHNDWNNARDGKYFDADDDKLKDYFKATRSY